MIDDRATNRTNSGTTTIANLPLVILVNAWGILQDLALEDSLPERQGAPIVKAHDRIRIAKDEWVFNEFWGQRNGVLEKGVALTQRVNYYSPSESQSTVEYRLFAQDLRTLQSVSLTTWTA